MKWLENSEPLKVRSSYGPLAYFSDIFISGKNVVLFYLGSLNAQTEIQTLNLTSSESFDDYCLVYLVAGPPSQTHVPVLPYFISESVSK